MNAVLTAQYPHDRHFLEMCDEIGLYVLDKLAGWQKPYSTAVGAKFVKEMVTFDVNYRESSFGRLLVQRQRGRLEHRPGR